MKSDITRLPAIPLICHDPFFSIWDCGYNATSGDTRHWSGAEKRLHGVVTVDGVFVRFVARSVQGGCFMPLLVKKWNE